MNDLRTLRYRCRMGAEPDRGRSARRRRVILVALAILVPAVPLAVGIGISLSQAGAGAVTPARTSPTFTPVTSSSATPATADAASRAGAKRGTTPGGSGALVALVLHSTALRATPGGRTLAQLGAHTEFGSPQALWVVTRVPGWLGVMAPEAPNNRVAWIAGPSASLSRVTWELKVSLGSRRLTVLDAGKVVEQYTVAVGAPGAPTPTGRFAVTDRLLTGDPAGPYGCCILALSAHSPHAIQGWTGGTRIAIHSTPDAASIGQAASHGCVRVTLAEGRWLLSHVPLGTPTLISS
jgi:lipoprotein-anchoring transpeptidase ErfK/SrfK